MIAECSSKETLMSQQHPSLTSMNTPFVEIRDRHLTEACSTERSPHDTRHHYPAGR